MRHREDVDLSPSRKGPGQRPFLSSPSCVWVSGASQPTVGEQASKASSPGGKPPQAPYASSRHAPHHLSDRHHAAMPTSRELVKPTRSHIGQISNREGEMSIPSHFTRQDFGRMEMGSPRRHAYRSSLARTASWACAYTYWHTGVASERPRRPGNRRSPSAGRPRLSIPAETRRTASRGASPSPSSCTERPACPGHMPGEPRHSFAAHRLRLGGPPHP